jgi:hypothetical protein
MNQKLDMFLIGMLGDNFGSLDNDVQALLKPMHIRSQSDEMLEIRIAQDTVGDALADERTNAVLGDLLKCSISPYAKLLKRAPGRSRNKSQGGRVGERGGHGETSTKRIAQFQRYSNVIVVRALLRFCAEISESRNAKAIFSRIPAEPTLPASVRQPKSNPKYQILKPTLNDLALFEPTNHSV